MTRRIRPDVLIVCLAIASGYLAAPQSGPVIPASGIPVSVESTPGHSPAPREAQPATPTETPETAASREAGLQSGTPTALRGVPEVLKTYGTPPPRSPSPTRAVARIASSPTTTTPSPAPRTARSASQSPKRALTRLHASARPQGVPRAVGRALTGTASWFCLPGRSACTSGYPASGAYAAAGPRLRAALGDWRGRTVLVTADGASVRVRLIDWCGCPDGRILDLYGDVFGQLARNGLSEGVIEVTVSWS